LGEWEWKQEFSISEQMIRIVDSCVSKEIEKTTTNKSDLFKLIYIDIEQEFYDLTDPPETTLEKNVNEAILQSIETAVSGDEQLEFIVEALKEGKKRTEIADLLDIKPRQFDKLREKLIRRINNPQPSPK
jgi:DNA-directed RNA polymerase specialized sigma subunit